MLSFNVGNLVINAFISHVPGYLAPCRDNNQNCFGTQPKKIENEGLAYELRKGETSNELTNSQNLKEKTATEMPYSVRDQWHYNFEIIFQTPAMVHSVNHDRIRRRNSDATISFTILTSCIKMLCFSFRGQQTNVIMKFQTKRFYAIMPEMQKLKKLE